MSILNWLSWWSGGGAARGKDLEEHLEFVNALKTPAIALRRSDSGGFSKIGGTPAIPTDLAWPTWRGAPLAFLCQIDRLG